MYDNNVLYAFVGATYSATGPTGLTDTTKPTTEGQIFIQYQNGMYPGTTGQTIPANTSFRIGRVNSSLVLEYSPWITPGKQLAKNVSGYKAPVQDVWTLTVEDGVEKGELKSIWLVIQDTLTTFGNKSMMKNAVYNTVTAPELKGPIADGLLASFNKNMLREPEKYVTVAAEAIPSVTGVLTFTGAARTNFKAGIWKSMSYNFKLLGDDVGAVAHTVAGHPGMNTEEQIKETEWFYQGHRGYGYRVDFLPVDSQLSSQAIYTTCVGDGTKAECTYLQWKDQNFVNVVGQEPASLIEAKVFLLNTVSATFNTALDKALAGDKIVNA